MKTFLKFSAAVIAIAIIAALVFPVYVNHHPPSPKSHLMSNMKQIGTGLMIYTLDYDGLLPNTQTRDQLITALEPYTKNPRLFEPVQENFHLPFEFNSNLAGVQIDLPQGIPLRDKQNFMSPSEAVMLYSIITRKGEPPAILTYADTSTRPLPKQEPFNPVLIFGPQFDRGNTKLQGEK